MNRYRFEDNVNEMIVKGILEGYKSYINERIEKKRSMRISGAYAWVRSNHIDNVVSKKLEDVGIKYKLNTAGGSWEYLEFTFNKADKEEKYLMLVKSPSFIKEFEKSSKSGKKHYIREYGKINKPIIETPEFEQHIIKQQEMQLILPGLDIDKSSFDLDRVYIIVYEVDKMSKMIKSIGSYLPSEDGKLYKVDDLTGYIESSGINFTEEEIEFSKSGIFEDEPLNNEVIFDFEVLETEEEKGI